MTWMFYEIERAARERDERNREQRMRFEIARAIRECGARCRQLASGRSLRGAFEARIASIVTGVRRAAGLSVDSCNCTPAA